MFWWEINNYGFWPTYAARIHLGSAGIYHSTGEMYVR
jgi:hypothetical protein